MASFRLNRRAFLRGAGGVAIALPLLEIMLDDPKQSHAATPPKRYLVCFGGQSLGSDCDTLHNDYVPAAPGVAGVDYQLGAKSALAPLAALQNDVTVVSGLGIPTANGGSVPAGGRADDFHINSLSPLFSGVRSGAQAVNGVTSDQIVANAIGNTTTFKSLVYRVQAGWYLSVSAPYGRDMMSYEDDGQGGVLGIEATVSPKAAFDSLFYNFTPAEDPDAAKQKDFEWRQRKSVLDLVSGNAERLVKRLGGDDKKRIQRHLDELRDLEKRVAALPPIAQGACEPPTSAPVDPTLGGNQGTDANGDNTYDQNLGYSGEEERARVFCDLVHMAFTCDLARVGSLMFTMAQSHLNMYPLTQQATDLHEIGHCGVPGGTMAVSTAIAWHMKHFAYLLDKFKNTQEDGGTLLDNSAIVFLHEGGHGYDPGGAKDNSAHSTENMACLVAGRAGGLQMGRHIQTSTGHPAQVLLTAMNAVGVSAGSLGEVSGTVAGLTG